jgi:hypothetical protein
MIFTLNSTGTYTIDLDVSIKTQYNLTNVLTIDGVIIVAATNLPYTATFTAGAHSIEILRTGASGTYKEKACKLTDKDILCKVIKHIESLPEEKRYKSQALYLYYILNAGINTLECTCQCTDLKTIYTDLNNLITDCC